MSDSFLTKSVFRNMVLRAADAVNTERWNAEPGSNSEVDILISMALDREWRRILNVAPYCRVTRQDLTSDGDGHYDMSSIFSDTEERLYRVIAVSRDDTVYREESFKDNVKTDVYSASWYVWWREGNDLVLSPVTAGVEATVWFNHIPQRFADLDTEDEIVQFPAGYEIVPINEAAALLLSKAGAEYNATQELKQLAQEYREDMLSDLARFSNNPMTFRYSDTSFEWGGS